MTCEFVHDQWGRCQQPMGGSGLCSFHLAWQGRMLAGVDPDRAYHEKIVKGLLESTFDYLTSTEANATVRGRKHQDGRRLDLYVTADPVEDEFGLLEELERDL